MQQIKTHLMCDEIQKQFPALQANIKKAMQAVDREVFVPESLRHLAFSIDPLPMANDQWISSPLTVAKMTQYLTPGDSVLEIGCGSGYQAMVLAQLFRRVFSIERIEKLLLEARERIRKSGVSNIITKLDDGKNGWKEYAPYDRILFSACLQQEIPQTIINQLEEGGILVAPIQEGNTQIIKRFTKRNGILCHEEILEQCLFVPVMDGIAK
ncbi:protein-L-isoaspartate(D-aspartate) O-methyltransferase [Helicobacter fennelliae]|uniref:Protein-L-isoaspartate O-methyltransferase n=2 Tax=Helicobacter fennelliae TaxID=215 RepID=T1D3Y4_9HELI|nr:protein-L-isoaspartate(D-aspartate) O-methyltransferase [Helicobacter fennelliae]GAD19911.1 protein-L-isoaspartate O-methyltransferase [Helicobacter fennelliae MRY12-0050]SQB98745.1 protein-L-isoaspartate O-methyltransferase [Helicobacter fennelliae]STP08087.1 protein-L-isoaspartate O-methyltransferase [Helicobacter fennelliae]STQ84005.1 protein-L-isoaspartate O-methyltransferase [Helicobacter fennelliae]